MAAPLLVTKLFIPPSRRELVPRRRLIEALSSGPYRPLTLISAPAGFGKTTLVTEWLNTLSNGGDARVAWLSLDPEDNDLHRFLTYFVSGLSRVAETDVAGEQALAWLQSAEPLSAEALLTPLINQIATGLHDAYYVLDDYHVIDSQAVNDAVAFLLDHLPPQLHLVITTREDPLLPLPRLRARGQLMEIRAADLRFSSSESAEFLNQVMSLGLGADDVAALEARTEGWIVGLQLAALSLRGQAEPSAMVRAFSGSHRLVLDYLVEEVLSRQNQYTQDFLLRTSILDRLTAPLCDVMMGRTGSQDVLEALDRANLFLVPLDHERCWFRYHHLFAELLRQKLRHGQPGVVPELHQRASLWFEQEAMSSDAIRHALAARAFGRAAELAEAAWPDWDGGHRSLQWLDWVKALPLDILQSRPLLCVHCAQAHLNGGQLEAAEARLQDAERWLAHASETHDPGTSEPTRADDAAYPALPAHLAMTRAYLAQARGDAAATMRCVNQALALIPEDDGARRTTAYLLLGLAQWTQGDLVAAYDVFSTGLVRNDNDFISGAFALADMQSALGHLGAAEALCKRALMLDQRQGPLPLHGAVDAHVGLSHIHRERGQLDAAALDLDHAQALGEQVLLPDWKHRWFIARARLCESLGELDRALDLLDDALRTRVRTPVPEVRPISALRARVLVRQGRLTEAQLWAHEAGLSAQDSPSYGRECEHLILARTLIAQSQQDRAPSPVHAAHDLLDRLAASAEGAGRMGSLIEILVMKALAYEAQSNLPAALKPLEKALALAEPEGYVRVFIDEGPPMAHLLYEALAARHSTKYGQRLLDAFPEMKRRLTAAADETHADGLEPLSERELEVLRLVADGMSNQDIADRLFLALNTVKAHTRSIYGKLGVNSRTQAIARARALGVLDSN